ncbi:unnamed protein product [Caenorhabditis bovis]|uniref:Protein kinase domain-containing protein n=1 Tax=Caenorhabditis bovis TaxID=2654633 RepID=A0A8S1EY52_9PELO|nr:unnamed protein product [Caenorhabditis bovis]
MSEAVFTEKSATPVAFIDKKINALVKDLATQKRYVAKMQSRKKPRQQDLDLNTERVFLYENICKFRKEGYISQLADVGFDDDFRYLIVEDFGKDLTHYYSNYRPFDAPTTFLITYYSFQALKELHSWGYLHLDLRPSSFAVKQSFVLKLIDFYHVTPSKPKPKNSKTFRCDRFSPRVMYKKDQEFDEWADIEAWLFTMIFLTCENTLPWRNDRDADKILDAKEKFFKSQDGFSWCGSVGILPLVPFLMESKPSLTDFIEKLNELFSIEVLTYDEMEQPMWMLDGSVEQEKRPREPESSQNLSENMPSERKSERRLRSTERKSERKKKKSSVRPSMEVISDRNCNSSN